MDDFSRSEPALTPCRFSVDLLWGKAPLQGGLFPSCLNGSPTGSGLFWPVEAGLGSPGLEEDGTEDSLLQLLSFQEAGGG